jgi:hypothetical protein
MFPGWCGDVVEQDRWCSGALVEENQMGSYITHKVGGEMIRVEAPNQDEIPFTFRIG